MKWLLTRVASPAIGEPWGRRRAPPCPAQGGRSAERPVVRVVPKVGFEPTRGCPQRCLRPPRLPFRHFGRGSRYRSRPRAPRHVTRRAGTRRPLGVSRGPMLDSPRLSNRRPEGPPDRGGPSLDDGRRRPRPAPRPDPARARRDGRPRRIQRPRRVLPGPAVRAGRAHGPGPRPGVRCRPGGVLRRLPEPRGFRGGASSRGSTGSRSTPRWTSSGPASVALSEPYPELEDESWQPPATEDADPVHTALTFERRTP